MEWIDRQSLASLKQDGDRHTRGNSLHKYTPQVSNGDGFSLWIRPIGGSWCALVSRSTKEEVTVVQVIRGIESEDPLVKERCRLVGEQCKSENEEADIIPLLVLVSTMCLWNDASYW